MSLAVRPSVMFLGADAHYMFAFRQPLMSAFQKKGYRVVVVAPALAGFNPEADGLPEIEFHHWPIRKASIDPLADLAAIRALLAAMRKYTPDVLFAHTIKPIIYGLPLAALTGVRRRTAMIPGLGYAFTNGTGWKRRVSKTLASIGYRAALQSASTVIFQNSDDRSMLIDLGALATSTPTAVVNGSGVDMTRFPATPIPPGPPTFLMVARLLKDKGVLEFVQAARLVRKTMPEAKFVLVGAPDSNPASVKQSDVDAWVEEGILEARGHVKNPQTEFAACTAFVLPSYYMEGCPRASLEAMSSARAVVTTDWVGCRETVVDGVTGILVPPRDARSLAAAILVLARDPALAKRMGEAGRDLCEQRFELTKVAAETLSYIEGDSNPPRNP